MHREDISKGEVMQEDAKYYFQERRRYPRYEVNYDVEIIFSGKKIFASTNDMSENGIGLLLPKSLIEGEIVNFKVKSRDDTERLIMQGEAKVVWCQYIDELGLYRAGLEILNISE